MSQSQDKIAVDESKCALVSVNAQTCPCSCVFAVMSVGIGQALFRTVWSRRECGQHGKCLDRLQLEFMTAVHTVVFYYVYHCYYCSYSGLEVCSDTLACVTFAWSNITHVFFRKSKYIVSLIESFQPVGAYEYF